MMEDPCRIWREQLGAYALGVLPEDQLAGLQEHLATCDRCRTELLELTPVAVALRDVDAAVVNDPEEPPADLRVRVFALLDRERQHQRRTDLARRLTAVAAAIALVAIGSLLRPAPAAAPTEAVALTVNDDTIAADAELINHTWGTEVILEATGLGAGDEYVLEFETTAGERVAGGTFLGVGERPLTCRMNAALLREDATGFTVTDAQGVTVLEAELAPPRSAGADDA